MHICYVCSEYPPAPHGGIGSFTQTLGRGLVEAGHQVTVVGIYKGFSGEDQDHGVRIFRREAVQAPLLSVLTKRARLREALLQIDSLTPIDILEGGEIDTGDVNPGSPGCKVLRMHGGPHFFATGSSPRMIEVIKERWAFHLADHICAVSQYVADTTRRLLKLGDRPITVIPNPVDVELFHPAADPSEEEDGLIVFAGTITERKGIRQLLQAMPRIVREAPRARLEIYGGEGLEVQGEPYTDELKAALPPEVRDRVLWKGRVARAALPGILRRASVCIYPSHMEAMPIAWLEGLATGKAVVASETGPGPELITDGVTGLLCNPHLPDSIASKVVAVLNNRDLRRTLGANARRTVLERYSLPQLLKRNIEYYSSLLKRSR